MDLRKKIRIIDDFPKKGISFKDVTPILKDPKSMKHTTKEITKYLEDKNIDVIVGPEARGFLFGILVAQELDLGFVPVRKPGKLPFKTFSVDYALEYGLDRLEIHSDSIEKGQNVAVVDDLLATGGTVLGVTKLVEKIGGNVSALSFVIELTNLNGRDKLKGYNVQSLVKYDDL
ncbi:adenine phosphoribosyltransferase [Methanococcus vannielii SB]|uniref:Adenine phosphoribosyltransferase n=1 Tax=Methanococcus vannielii (strain ATCC 35089 / DSM 1224 / JCM 13029 / OCM 148 / SB) TaxID=406327 RepID=APT_METVS|nr:adenine phosphoribosyltransferase [Methanococcus vannielii]A6USF2.1 RecName: Full=Adenine phosphoribosyltransferase; Short=APRT [Methanococcus vannielii SB]ABR55424.1 adenine phosphoribosyltransferase [Methanococcus vannielii SB]